METNKNSNIKKNSSTAKELNSQLKILEGKIDAKKSEVANSQKELELMKKNAEEIRNKISSLGNVKRPVVSEHAMLRYLERVKKIDMKTYENEILSDKVLKMIADLGGNGAYPHEGGFQLVMKNNVVVTIKV